MACLRRKRTDRARALGSMNPPSVPSMTRSVTGLMRTQSTHRYTQVDLKERDDDRSHALGVIHKSSWRNTMMIVPTLCVGMPPRTLRVRSRMWRRCVDKLQRYPRHALGLLNPQSVPFVTRSVTGGMPTQSVGTISVETDLCITSSAEHGYDQLRPGKTGAKFSRHPLVLPR